ncbi:hypothetical protein ACFRFL_45190 [Streptomyces sp. NPDC056708]|uniref:hypothetical protein n=1 Tax=unclassified Streptomyces TaxID=2593676 RepID=UPI0036A1C343
MASRHRSRAYYLVSVEDEARITTRPSNARSRCPERACHPPPDRYNATAQPFQWKFTTSDLDDLPARLDRHTADHHEESSAAPAV